MSSKDVLARCEQLIESIKQTRHDIDTAYQSAVIRKHNWWAKWFWWIGFRPITQETVHDYLMQDMSFARMLEYPSHSHWTQFDIAVTIRNMAEKAESINIGREDYAWLFT